MALTKESLGVSDEQNKQEDQKPAAEEKKLPKKIRVTHLHGYYDDNGAFREWKEGFITSDEAEVKLLVDRGAPIQVLDQG